MAMTINTNVVSINAQRNLGLSGGALATSMQRLSSGLRVNSAKDDAAGLAISERMGAQAKGLAVAARNANDGISLAQTAEGALGKVGDMLQRMRELAVQSANATNSETDRKALQAEVSQMVAEIDRVAKTSSFNGKKLLDGTFSGAVFQVGANAGDNITVGSLADATAKSIGHAKYSVSAASTAIDTTVANLVAVTTDITMAVTDGTNSKTITLGKLDAATSASERLADVVELINAKTAESGVVAFLETGGTTYKLYSTANSVSTNANTSITFGGGATTAANLLGFSTTAATLTASAATDTLQTVDVSSQAGAWKAIQHIDKALDQVNSARGTLGALQTRFEKSVENIDIMNENISAARGRIVDADFAKETASLSTAQILQQAGTAMVAQANQMTQNVLSLLQ